MILPALIIILPTLLISLFVTYEQLQTNVRETSFLQALLLLQQESALARKALLLNGFKPSKLLALRCEPLIATKVGSLPLGQRCSFMTKKADHLFKLKVLRKIPCRIVDRHFQPAIGLYQLLWQTQAKALPFSEFLEIYLLLPEHFVPVSSCSQTSFSFKIISIRRVTAQYVYNELNNNHDRLNLS